MCTRMTTKGTSNFNFQSITHDTRKVPWYLVPCTSCNPIECSRDHNHGRDVELMAQNRLRIIEGNCVLNQENEPFRRQSCQDNFTLKCRGRALAIVNTASRASTVRHQPLQLSWPLCGAPCMYRQLFSVPHWYQGGGAGGTVVRHNCSLESRRHQKEIKTS